MQNLLRRLAFKIEQMIAFVQATRTPISLTLDLFKIKRRSFVAVTNDGIKLSLEPSCGESFTFFENLVRRDYLTTGIKLKVGDTVVDIGANIGSFAVLAGTLVGSCGRVIAFEPVPAICKRLKHNIALNGLQNVECISAALDAQDGTMLMTTLPKSALSTAHLRFNLEAPGMQVETITLAHACVEHNIDRIHLLKIDCEGSEYGIFETMPRDLAVRIDQIAMEVHEVEDHSADDLVILLETLGFSVTRKGCNWFAVQTRNSGSADIAIRRYVTPLGALAHKP